ncbi:sulfotransferase family protein [Fontivita pretiosa]|uniref:sulfotransferase family protein n=1 Tax=Fontivita pretiosa TaxID=2989684 RepID=UPI003D164A6E
MSNPPFSSSQYSQLLQQLPITIVSGLPRSGTSLMMQMLDAGGMPVLTDGIRQPDAHNPRGYFEYEPVKRIQTDQSWLDQAHGKAVKMVHLLVPNLPPNRHYQLIFMHRRIEEVLISQRKMLADAGKSGGGLSDAILARTFQTQVNQVRQWVQAQPNFRMIEVWYHQLIADPAEHAARISYFLGMNLDQSGMIAAVDPELYRNRSQASA